MNTELLSRDGLEATSLRRAWPALQLACRVFYAFAFAICVFGCATVPKEAVELSYVLGNDLESLHSSYRELVKAHFETLRSERLTFLENRLTPVFLERFMKEANLVAAVSGDDPAEVFEDLQLFVEVAMEKLEAKRDELIVPIDQDEKALLVDVDEAFARAVRANALITAHLNSLREVQEVQDEALEALQLKDLRDQIRDGLVRSDAKAAEALEKFKKAEGIVDDAAEKKEELRKQLKGANDG